MVSNFFQHVKSGNLNFDLRVDDVVYGEITASFE